MYCDNPCTELAATYLSDQNLHQIAKKSPAAQMNTEMTQVKIFWQGHQIAKKSPATKMNIEMTQVKIFWQGVGD